LKNDSARVRIGRRNSRAQKWTPRFHSLQQYGKKSMPLQYVAFDLLYLDGCDLRAEPLRERKELLREILPQHPQILYSEHVEERGIEFFDAIKKKHIEGMVAKDADSPYLEGARTSYWRKVKNIQQQEAIIVAYTEPRGSRKMIGALVLAAYDKGELRYIGHSGGGFTGKEIKDLYDKLSK